MPVATYEPNARTFVQTSNLFCTNSVVLSGEQSTLLIDPAWFADELAALRARVAASPAGRATHLAVTHCDGDHLGQWEQFADLPIIAAPGEDQLDWSTAERWQNWINDLLLIPGATPFRRPAPEHIVWQERLDLGGLTVLFVPVRGHTVNSQFLVVPEQRLLIAGDYMSDVMPPLVRTSFADYLAALDRLQAVCSEYAVDCIIPGHGGPLCGAAAIGKRIEGDADYVRQVATGIAAAHSAGLTPDEAIVRTGGLTYQGRPALQWPSGIHGANIKMAYGRSDTAGL